MPVFDLFGKGPAEASFRKLVTIDQISTTVPIETILSLQAHEWLQANGPSSTIELRNAVGTVLVRLTSDPSI